MMVLNAVEIHIIPRESRPCKENRSQKRSKCVGSEWRFSDSDSVLLISTFPATCASESDPSKLCLQLGHSPSEVAITFILHFEHLIIFIPVSRLVIRGKIRFTAVAVGYTQLEERLIRKLLWSYPSLVGIHTPFVMIVVTVIAHSQTFSVFHIAKKRSREVLEQLVGAEFSGYLGFDYFSANCSFAWKYWIKAESLPRNLRWYPYSKPWIPWIPWGRQENKELRLLIFLP